MPECHKCQYNETASEICLDCPGPSQERNAAEVSRSGVSMLSLDAMQDNRHESDYENTYEQPRIEQQNCPFKGLSTKQSNAICKFFNDWIRRSPVTRDTIAARMANPELSNKQIAAKLGITDQHVSNILLSFFRETSIRGRKNKPRKH